MMTVINTKQCILASKIFFTFIKPLNKDELFELEPMNTSNTSDYVKSLIFTLYKLLQVTTGIWQSYRDIISSLKIGDLQNFWYIARPYLSNSLTRIKTIVTLHPKYVTHHGVNILLVYYIKGCFLIYIIVLNTEVYEHSMVISLHIVLCYNQLVVSTRFKHH